MRLFVTGKVARGAVAFPALLALVGLLLFITGGYHTTSVPIIPYISSYSGHMGGYTDAVVVVIVRWSSSSSCIGLDCTSFVVVVEIAVSVISSGSHVVILIDIGCRRSISIVVPSGAYDDMGGIFRQSYL